jgi:hypothetical protein
MKLIKDIIENELKIKDFYLLRKFYVRGFDKFFKSYTWAIAFLILNGQMEADNKGIHKRNRLYKNLLLKRNVNDKEIKKLNKLINEDFRIINKAITQIEKINENLSNSYGSFYRHGIIAVDMDEFPLD